MRKLLSLLAIFAATSASAELITIPLTITAMPTSSTPTVVYSGPVSQGWLEAIYLDQAAATTANVSVATVATGGGSMPAQTLLTQTNLSADAWYYVRQGAVDTTNGVISGAVTRFALQDANIRLSVHSASATNKAITAYIVIEK